MVSARQGGFKPLENKERGGGRERGGEVTIGFEAAKGLKTECAAGCSSESLAASVATHRLDGGPTRKVELRIPLVQLPRIAPP